MGRQKLLGLFRQHSEGFGLIETVIAVALLGIIAAGFLGAMATSYKVTVLADEQVTAKSLARSWMEYIEQLEYISAPDDGEATYTFDPATYTEIIADIHEGYTIFSVDREENLVEFDNTNGIKGVPWDPGEADPADPFNPTSPAQVVTIDESLQKITLVIKYHGAPSFTLEGFKVKQ
ncbi:prepilin-type N-terminal cleavage/methylation domain-containing protein [Chloroflexota bacterium]